jgi:hypothetical protein
MSAWTRPRSAGRSAKAASRSIASEESCRRSWTEPQVQRTSLTDALSLRLFSHEAGAHGEGSQGSSTTSTGTNGTGSGTARRSPPRAGCTRGYRPIASPLRRPLFLSRGLMDLSGKSRFAVRPLGLCSAATSRVLSFVVASLGADGRVRSEGSPFKSPGLHFIFWFSSFLTKVVYN